MGSMSSLHNHAVADAVGLHQTDHECLDLLDWAGPLTAGEIAMHLGLTSGAVTALIDRLEHGGWVRRQRDTADRRRVIVHPADDRMAEIAPIYEHLGETIERYRDRLSAADLRTVVEFLETANAALAEATRRTRER
ncbi:MAG TPA: MarR family transcriptional regulator [Acidimicrobiales bacterium]|nr:MarR family transcriptional regulator [Acidimicrobiales bacterium]